MSSFARAVSLALVLFSRAGSPVGAVKWPFNPPKPTPKQQVKVSFDDESFSFWDPFKHTGFNASATVIPLAEEVGRRAPGYLAYATLATGFGLFLPPKAIVGVNVAYVVAAVARSHEGGVETFCKDEGRLLLGSPSVHLALVGTALRALRFRAWRRLFVRATLFRLRYQLRFMRIHKPNWVAQSTSPLGVIVQNTAHAARSVQGLFPDLCLQAALFAGGCRVPHWSDCSPPVRVEKGWGTFRCLDRQLKQEFGTRARRVRPGDDSPLGPGFLGWRIPHRVARRVGKLGGKVLNAPASRTPTEKNKRKRKPRQSRRAREREAKEIAAEEARLLEILEGDPEQEDGVVVEVLDETSAPDGREEEGVQQDGPSQQQEEAPGAVPADGPLIRFHNVTAVASRGSTLTKSYHALAELPYGGGHSDADDAAAAAAALSRKSLAAWAAPDPVDDLNVDAAAEATLQTRAPPALQPVVVKRTVARQLLLAEDDIAAARKVLRRMTFKAEVDLDLSGVVAESAAAVARAGDLRSEAESIESVRSNLAQAGMLGSAVGVPEVVSCAELGALARPGVLVTTALRGVDVSDTYVMEHAAPQGGKERARFVDGVFTAFGQMCLADGCFPSNPTPENLLYMYSGQVGLTDLSSVNKLTEDQRRALCRLYRTMAELKGEDAASPSEAAEVKARAAMEGVGLVIDLPPAGGVAWSSSASYGDWTAEQAAAGAVASAAESALDATLGETPDEGDKDGDLDGEVNGGDKQGGEDAAEVEEDKAEKDGEEKEEEEEEEEVEEEEEEEEGGGEAATPPPSPMAPLTHVMLLRGLFDTQREEALDLVGGGGGQLLKGMAVRRLPQAMVPVLRMVANLRGICSHLDVDKSLLPRFSRAASKGLSWRFALSTSRGGGSEQDAEAGTPLRPAAAAKEATPAPALV